MWMFNSKLIIWVPLNKENKCHSIRLLWSISNISGTITELLDNRRNECATLLLRNDFITCFYWASSSSESITVDRRFIDTPDARLFLFSLKSFISRYGIGLFIWWRIVRSF